MKGDQRVFLVTQKDIIDDDPSEKQLYQVGGARIKQILRMQENLTRILVEGEYRAKLAQVLQTEPCLLARVESMPEVPLGQLTPKAEALMREAAVLFDEFLELVQNLPGNCSCGFWLPGSRVYCRHHFTACDL